MHIKPPLECPKKRYLIIEKKVGEVNEIIQLAPFYDVFPIGNVGRHLRSP